MHDDLDVVEVDAVEQAGLEQLEALVDQGGGVDGDHPAHRPGGVGHRLLGRDVAQLGRGCGRGTARRTRSGSAGAPRRRGRRAAPGRTPSARSRRRRSGPGAAASVTRRPPITSDSLLARASVVPAASAARVGSQPGGAGDAVEHHVGTRSAASRVGGVRPGPDLDAGQLRRRRGRRRPGRSPRRRAGRSARACSTSRSTEEPPAARPVTRSGSGRRGDHVDRLGADRAGTAQNHHLTHAGPTSRSQPTMAAYPAGPRWLLCEGDATTNEGARCRRSSRWRRLDAQLATAGTLAECYVQSLDLTGRSDAAARRRRDARRLPRLQRSRPASRRPRESGRAGLPEPARPAVQPVPVGPLHRRRALRRARTRPPLHPGRARLPLVAPRRPAPQPDQRRWP